MRNQLKEKINKEHETLKKSAEAYIADEQKLLKRHGLSRRIVVTFPFHVRVPMTGALAVKLLKWSRAVIDTEFSLIKK